MVKKDMASEKEYAVAVGNFLESETERLRKQITDYKSSIKTLGSDFNLDNPNGGMYSGAELSETHSEMEKQMIYADEAAGDIHFFRKLKKAPYFAKVTFKAENAPRERDIYIGLRTLQEHETFKMLVCDWRAPVASLFYEDFDSAKAFYKAPAGNIYGDLLNKRQFKFENGALVNYVDSDIKIDDDILKSILSSSSTDHLKVIVSSIQREQNKVIRHSDNENLLVIGPAGSGKTSVGFHRLAYLLYRNRTELSSAEIIMFSNNDIFSSYVADIIPELGETPINYASIYSIFKAELPEVRVSDYYSLAEAVINGDEQRARCAEIKLNGDFADFIKENIDNIEIRFSDIVLYGKVILSAEQLLQRFLNDTENNIKIRIDRLTVFAHSVIDHYFADNRKEILDIVDSETIIAQDTHREFKKKCNFLKSDAALMIREGASVEPIPIYFRLLEEYARSINCPELLKTKEALMKGYLEFEDAIGTVYVKNLLGTSAVLSGVKHILIDEAQDFSVLQHKIILNMFPRALVTLLADTNQAILPSLNTTSADTLAQLYGAKTVFLNKSYRSTKQINDFALSLLEDNRKYDIFEREGSEVEAATGSAQELAKLLERYANISNATCIITKTVEEATNLYSALKPAFPDLTLCHHKACRLSDSPVIMPLALTKGLEFDNVIISNNGGFDGKENEKYLYMAATRALHKLSVFNIK